MTRRAFLAATLTATACSPSREIKLTTWDDVVLEASRGPGVVYFWALWSRSSIEFLGTVAELAGEYDGLRFLAVCLDDDPESAAPQALALARRLPVWIEHRAAPLDFEKLYADFQISEPPAAVIHADSDLVLTSLEGETLTPEGLDAMVAEAAAMMTSLPLGR